MPRTLTFCFSSGSDHKRTVPGHSGPEHIRGGSVRGRSPKADLAGRAEWMGLRAGPQGLRPDGAGVARRQRSGI